MNSVDMTGSVLILFAGLSNELDPWSESENKKGVSSEKTGIKKVNGVSEKSKGLRQRA